MIKRKLFERGLSIEVRNNKERTSQWRTPGMVVLLQGRKGAGKTTALLQFAEKEKAVYLSFRNLGNQQALKLFAKRIGYAESVDHNFTWNDAFELLGERSKQYSKVLLDDFDIAAQNKEFLAAFEHYRMKDEWPKTFFLLAMTDGSVVSQIKPCTQLALYHYSLQEVKGILPKRKPQETLEVYALTGGVPGLVPLFAGQQTIWECLVEACKPGSLWLEWFPRYMNETFRSPQVYYEILYAIACGNKRISEIGTAVGYPYNKCNSYIKNLIAADVVEAYTMTNEAGIEKTGYRFACSYYKLWMQMVYMNQTAFTAGRAAEIVERYRTEMAAMVQEEYRAACYRTVKHKMKNVRLKSEAISDCPLDVPLGNSTFHFDCFKKGIDGTVLYVKIYDDGENGYSLREENRLCKAAAERIPIYDGDAFVFSVIPYGKDDIKRSGRSETIHLYTAEQLQYPAGY